MNQERHAYLLQGWINKQLSAEEIDEFMHTLQDDTFRQHAGEHFIQSLTTGQFEHLETKEEREKALALLLARISTQQAPTTEPASIKRSIKYKPLAAAAVLTALCITGYFIFFKKQASPSPVIVQEKINYPVINQALITLPDGTQLRIDTISSSIVLARYGIQIEKTPDGRLVYKSINNEESFTALPVKIENPRGSTPLHVQLTDGSAVWLNAQSAISYPTMFAADKREVNISGEAYFEVAKDPAKKFIVKTQKQATEVLGTHFNVKDYEDETAARITLLEGSVKVYASQSAEGSRIVPNQQAIVSDQQVQVTDVNIKDVMAWKNDLLSFNNSDIKTIMLEICRWYDVDVVYAQHIPDKKFSGYISRQTPLEDILLIIRQSGFNLKTEGRKIYVLSH